MPVRESTSHPNIFIYLDGTYYYRGTIKGRRVEISLETKKWRSALEKARKLEASENIADQSGGGLRVEDVLPIFMKEKEKTVYKDGKARTKRSISQKHFENYERLFVNHLLPFYKFKKLSDLEQDDKLWETFKEKGQATLPENLKATKIHWVNFKRWCVNKGFFSRLHSNLDIPITQSRKPTPFNKVEFEILLEICSKSPRRRSFLLFNILYGASALRRQEITALEWQMINFEKSGLLSKKFDTSTKTQRLIPFNAMVRDALIAHHKWQLKSEIKSIYVFPNALDPKRPMDPSGFKGTWTRVLEECKRHCIENKIKSLFDGHRTPHDLRRMWAVYANLDPNLTDMQRTKFAGHSKDVQRENYVDFHLDQLRPAAEVMQISGYQRFLPKTQEKNSTKSHKTKRKVKFSGGKLGETGAKRA